MIFKILLPQEWEKFKNEGKFFGSIDDQRDGFIHLATAEQLSIVLEKYFKDIPVYIAEYNPEDFGENLKWESGYPHLYNSPLRIEDTISTIYEK